MTLSGTMSGTSNYPSDTVIINGTITVGTNYGYLVIYADTIIVSNSINADGKGFPGGGGGGGAGENGGGTQGGTGSATVGGENGTAGTAGKIGGNGGKGGGTATWEGYPPGEGDPSVGSKSTGGNGGVGGGPYGGAGGPTPTPPSYDGQNAGRGGYNNTGVNDELSIGTFCSQYRGLNVDKDPLFQYIMNEFKMTNGKWVVGGCRCFDRCSVS